MNIHQYLHWFFFYEINIEDKNNMEKILRIKKGNVKPGEKPELTNNARDFLGGR